MTPEQLAELREFATRIGRLTPEQEEARKWERWIRGLRKREDPIAYEIQEDRREGDTYW